MAVKENGYCTSFILMSAQLELEGIQGDEPLSPFHFHCVGLWVGGGWEGDRVEGEGGFSGLLVGRLRSVSESRGYWGHFCLRGLLGHFLGFLFPHLAMHEAGDEGGDHKDA